MRFRFTKMHGIGNDYVYVNGFTETVSDPARLAQQISNRHFGVGSDGLILILPSTKADVRMRMFNADGSEAEMCGNGIRCVAKYAYEHGLSKNNPMRVETGAGVLTLQLQIEAAKVRSVTVDMGKPTLELAKIPVDETKIAPGKEPFEFILPIRHGSEKIAVNQATFVSMGNPHVVMFVPNVAAIDVGHIGPIIEQYEAFPNRINAHWVQIISPSEVIMRTWERGSGITQACGTGACAVCVAGALTNHTDRKILAHLPGGDLHLDWRDTDDRVYMTGPATEVFSGDWPNDGRYLGPTRS